MHSLFKFKLGSTNCNILKLDPRCQNIEFYTVIRMKHPRACLKGVKGLIANYDRKIDKSTVNSGRLTFRQGLISFLDAYNTLG